MSSAPAWAHKRAENSSATRSSTMKRLAEMQLWPVFEKRALAAAAAARSMSVSASTMKGSEPPSSSTCFFMARPACAATSLPTAVEPVSVTAAMRGSSISAATRSGSMNTLPTRPGTPMASRNRSSRASAHCGTLPACLSTAPLPAHSVGAAKRTNCQNG